MPTKAISREYMAKLDNRYGYIDWLAAIKTARQIIRSDLLFGLALEGHDRALRYLEGVIDDVFALRVLVRALNEAGIRVFRKLPKKPRSAGRKR